MLYRTRVVLLIAVSLLAAPLSATVLVPVEFREVVNESEIIAFGRVVETTPQWAVDRKRVDTLVTLQVGTYLKGGPGDTIVFKVPGGQMGRYRHFMVGAPHFEPGDEAVVFLNAGAGAGERPSVFGLNQGVYRVRADARTRQRIVVPPALIGRDDRAERVVRGAVSRQSVPLEAFGAQVQTIIAERARGIR
jgi:hypothetical protein